MTVKRRGFTLVELLMVIVVISILASLLTVAAMSVISRARESQTTAVLAVCQKIISDRAATLAIHEGDFSDGDLGRFFMNIDKEIQLIQALPVSQQGDFMARLQDFRTAVVSRVNIVENPSRRFSQIVTTLESLRSVFPQTWDEAEFDRIRKRLPKITGGSKYENSEVLCYMITEGAGYTLSDSDALTANIRDTDGNGLPEIVDGWGKPIRFYRWPTRLLRPDGLDPSYRPRSVGMVSMNIPATDPKYLEILSKQKVADKLVEDPHDPLALIPNERIPDADIISGSVAGHVSDIENAYHLPNTSYFSLVLSAGADGVYGLEDPANKGTYGYWGKPVAQIEALYDDLAGLK